MTSLSTRNAHAAKRGLTPGRRRVLVFFAEHPAASPSRAALAFGMTRGAVSQHMAGLRTLGLLDFEPKKHACPMVTRAGWEALATPVHCGMCGRELPRVVAEANANENEASS